MYSEFTFYFIAGNRFALTFKKTLFFGSNYTKFGTYKIELVSQRRTSCFARWAKYRVFDNLLTQKNFTQQKTAPEKI